MYLFFHYFELINYNNIYKQHSKWGLGAILGFNKDTVTSKKESNKNNFKYDNTEWVSNDNNIIESFKAVDLDEYQNIYIEVDKRTSSNSIL